MLLSNDRNSSYFILVHVCHTIKQRSKLIKNVWNICDVQLWNRQSLYSPAKNRICSESAYAFLSACSPTQQHTFKRKLKIMPFLYNCLYIRFCFWRELHHLIRHMTICNRVFLFTNDLLMWVYPSNSLHPREMNEVWYLTCKWYLCQGCSLLFQVVRQTVIHILCYYSLQHDAMLWDRSITRSE